MQRNKYGPRWRWETAQFAATSRSGKPLAYYDALTKLSAEFLRQRTAGRRRKVSPEFDAIEAAETIEEDFGLRETLQILTIGGVELQHIADMSGVPSDQIHTWEKLFFDVRECRNRPAWIRGKVIRPFEDAGKTTFASRLKVALAGGAAVAQNVIESDVRIPVEEAERIVDAELKLHQKLVEATDILIGGSADAVQLLTAHMEHTLAVKQLEFEREKFREQCEAEARRHEIAMQRLKDPERLLAAREASSHQWPDDE